MCNSLPLASSVLNVQWLILKPFKGFFSFLKVPNIPKMDWFDFLNWVRLMQCRKWCWRPPKWCPFCWSLLWISWMFPIFFMDWRNLLFLFIIVTSQVFNVQEYVIYRYCFYIYELLTCLFSYPKLFPRILMATSRNLLMKMAYFKKNSCCFFSST
jgi:hypothetical protein